MNTRMNIKMCTKLTVLITLILCVAASTGLAYDTVLLRTGGLLNGQVVDDTNYTVEVEPGQAIAGTINIRALNDHANAGAIVPVAATVTWGNRATQPWRVSSHISQGWHNLTANVNKTAPTAPGTYYIVFGNQGEFNEDQIMSATNWAFGTVVWHDGNDLGWDWSAAQFQQAHDTGTVTQLQLGGGGIYGSGNFGANWVAVEVVDPAPVFFADANLKAAVETELGVTDPNAAQMKELTFLDASGLAITDLVGLESAANITSLVLFDNQISDLAPLTVLSDLTELWLSENQINDISPLAGLLNLTHLNLGVNLISDISPLAGLLNLTNLYLWNNQISDISYLAGMTNLTRLGLSTNQISDISVLAGLTNLETLLISDNLISNISPLADMINLTELSLQINDLDIAAYSIFLPRIEANNPGISLWYDLPNDWNAADYVAAGRVFLFDRTLTGIRNAYLIFDYGINSVGTGDRDLVFLHALTRAMMLVVEDGQTEMTSLFELAAEFGMDVVGDSLENRGLDAELVLNANGHYEMPANAPDEDEIRDLLDNSTIPEIEAILAELDLIGDSSGDRFRIFFTPQETSLEEPLEVDFGDVLILKAFLKMVKSQMRQSDAYDLEIDDPNRIIAEIYGDSFNANDDLLIPYPDLLKVQPTAGQPGDGAAALAQARQDLLDGIDRFFEAVDYMRNEEDDQLDDLIYIDPRAQDGLERAQEKLADLQDSLLNDHAITHTTETTRNYLLHSGSQANQVILSLAFDALDIPDSDKGGLAVIGSPGYWIIEEAEIDEWDLFVMFHGEEEGSSDGGTLTGTINKELNEITEATFEYWGSQSGTIYDLSGLLITTEKIEKQLDLNPIYGSSPRYPDPVNPRDLLPEFDPWNGPQPGTVGQGLMNSGQTSEEAAQLGGILPSVADQEEWIRETNMQPGGRISLYQLNETEQIQLDGQINEWNPAQLILTDIAGDTEEPNWVSGLDIEELYLALSEDGVMLYGAITTYDIIDPGSANYKPRYRIYLSYVPDNKESLNNHSFVIDADKTTGKIYRYEYPYGYWEWVQIGSFDVRVGQRSLEFAIPVGDPEIPLPGRFIYLESDAYNNYNTEETGEDNDTHLQIASFGSENQLFSISGNVIYTDYQDGPIVVQAYTNQQDPDNDNDLVASTVLHNGPGPFTLEGIGQGWVGYVRAFAPVTGANYFEWHHDNKIISNTEIAEVVDGDLPLGEDLIINPWHDFCEHAVPLQIGVPFSSSSENATGEDLTGYLGAYDDKDVWHSFTPDIDGVYRISRVAGYNATLAVFDSCGGDMLAFGLAYDGDLHFNALGGKTYLIRVAGEWWAAGPYEITVNYFDLPLENDFCDQALPLIPDSNSPVFTFSGDTLGATGTDLTPQGAYDYFDVWHSFTVSQDGVYSLIGDVSAYTTIAVFDACGGNMLAFQEISSAIDLRIHCLAGKKYLIRIAGERNRQTVYDVVLAYAWEPPVNDLCADATEIFLDDDPVHGNTILATGQDLSSCVYNDYRDVWYQFTAPFDSLYQIDVSLITAQAVTISMFEKCGGEEILCRGDNYAYFNGKSGENYLIRVATTPVQNGEFDITISQSSNPAVANDIWQNALPIYEGDYIQSTTAGATGEDITDCGSQDHLDVWYIFAPTQNGEFTIDFTSSTEFSTVAVFKYDWPLWMVGLGEIECLDENRDNTMNFEGRTDRLYLIRVAGQEHQSVNFSLSLTGPEVGWCELTTEVIGDGIVEPSSGRYEEDTDVLLEAIPAPNWYFIEWQGDASGSNPNIQIVMDSDKEVTAVFEEGPRYYNLSIDVIGQGDVELDPPGGVYENVIPVNLTAISAPGWHFVEWQGDAMGTDPFTEIVMDSDKQVTAVFEEEPGYPTFYDLTVDVVGQGSV